VDHGLRVFGPWRGRAPAKVVTGLRPRFPGGVPTTVVAHRRVGVIRWLAMVDPRRSRLPRRGDITGTSAAHSARVRGLPRSPRRRPTPAGRRVRLLRAQGVIERCPQEPSPAIRRERAPCTASSAAKATRHQGSWDLPPKDLRAAREAHGRKIRSRCGGCLPRRVGGPGRARRRVRPRRRRRRSGTRAGPP